MPVPLPRSGFPFLSPSLFPCPKALRSLSVPRWSLVVACLVVGLLGFGLPLSAEAQQRAGTAVETRLPVEGLPDLVIPPLDPRQGRRLFAERACVVCHTIGGVGGRGGGALGGRSRPETLDLLDFVAGMWRGGLPMLHSQRALFGAEVDLTGEEIGHLIAFLTDPGEQALFSEKDIPEFILAFMKRHNLDRSPR